MLSIYPLFLLATGGILLTIGDIVMKHWVVNGGAKHYGLGLVVYLAGLNLLAHSFRFKSIAVASVVFILFNVVSLAIAGFYLYNEKPTATQLAGMSLALAAVICLESGE